MESPLKAVLTRWIALDAALRRPGGVDIYEFAQQHGVSVKTVGRDIKLFAEFGPKASRLGRRRWIYPSGAEAMFTRTPGFGE